jgi:hypothetical protein
MALRDIVGALRDEEFWRDMGRNTLAMGELGIEFGEGAVGEIGGGITGLAKLATGSSFEEAGEAMENVQDWAGSWYEPKYQETEDYMQSIGGAVQPLVENFDTSALWLEDNFGIPRELTKGSALAALELTPLKFVPTGVPNALRRYDPTPDIGQTVPPRDVLGYTPDNLNFDYGDMPFDIAAPVATTGGSSAISNFIEKNVPLVTGLNVVPDSPRLSDALRTPTKEVDELGFFSRALDEAKNLKQEKGTGQQMKAMLLKANVKQDEIDWTGLDKILSKDKVTKTEIVDYLSEHQLKFGERVARGSSDEDIFDWGDSEVLDDYDNYAHRSEDIAYNIESLTPEQINKGFDFAGSDKLARSAFSSYIPTTSFYDEFLKQTPYGLEHQLKSVLNNMQKENPSIYDDVALDRIRTHFSDGNLINDLDDKTRFDFNEGIDAVAREEYMSDPYIKVTDPNTGMTITGNDDIGYQIFTSPEDSGNWENAVDLGPYDVDVPYNLNEAKIQAEMVARDNLESWGGTADDLGIDTSNKVTQYSEFVEPGGENYQEIQFTLASDELPVGSKAAEIDYNSPHFDNPDSDNMIFHIRTTDRTTPDGKKVLYIEELQSDWGQRGRKTRTTEGFELKGEERTKVEKRKKELKDNLNKKGKEVRNILAKEDYLGFDSPDEMMRDLKNWKKSAEKTDNVRWNEMWEVPGLSANEIKIVDDFFDKFFKDRIEIEKLEKKLASDIPEGPFVGATDKWTELAIKRLIAKAQKEGYDQISFSPGDVQSGRWGDEGLAEYYDEIIPKVAKKLTKKMDNVSVGKSDVQMVTDYDDLPQPYDQVPINELPPLAQLKEARFTIKLSPDKEFEGFPYMSLAPFGAAPIVESLRQEQPIY